MKVVHCQKEPYDVYIGRPYAYGNPFVVGKDGTRAKVIELYEKQLRKRKDLVEFLKPIAGKTLGCWCSPKPCHGDVLIKLCKELKLIEEQ